MRVTLPLLAGAALLTGTNAAETLLYQTDFSNFPGGDGELVGRDGWESTHAGELVHGTVDDILGEGNRSGTIGFNAPESDDGNLITLYRPLGYDPLGESTPLVQFRTDLALIDSDNGYFDSFHISVYNRDERLLGSVIFDNTEEALGIWRHDGDIFEDTQAGFDHAQLYQLGIDIDYANNTWSARLDEDITLFTDAPFNATGETLDLGDFSVAWEITDIENPGNNWLVFDNWEVSALSTDAPPPNQPEEVPFLKIDRNRRGNFTIEWDAKPNVSYQVQHSADLVTWRPVPPSNRPEEAPGRANVRAEGAARYFRVTMTPEGRG